jgi:hypothetical protein
LVISESNHTTSAAQSGPSAGGWLRSRASAGHELQADVEADGPAQQIVDLLIRLGAGDGFRQRGQHDLRHRQSQRTADLAADQLGDQRLLPMAGAAELDDVLAPVIGLGHGRQRAALAQWRGVAGDGDAADHLRSVLPGDAEGRTLREGGVPMTDKTPKRPPKKKQPKKPK